MGLIQLIHRTSAMLCCKQQLAVVTPAAESPRRTSASKSSQSAASQLTESLVELRKLNSPEKLVDLVRFVVANEQSLQRLCDLAERRLIR